MKPKHDTTQGGQYSEAETIRRRDEAVRRALNTPPKPYKDSKVGKVDKGKQPARTASRKASE